MVKGVESGLDERQDLGVGRHVRAGVVLRPNRDVPHDGRLEDLSCALETTDGDLDVRFGGQPVRVDQRLVVHAG